MSQKIKTAFGYAWLFLCAVLCSSCAKFLDGAGNGAAYTGDPNVIFVKESIATEKNRLASMLSAWSQQRELESWNPDSSDRGFPEIHRNFLSRHSVSAAASRVPSQFILSQAGRVNALLQSLTDDTANLNAKSVYLDYQVKPVQGLNSQGEVESDVLAAASWREAYVNGVRVQGIIKLSCTRIGERDAAGSQKITGARLAAILWHELSHIALDRQDQEPNLDEYIAVYEKFGTLVSLSEGLLTEYLMWNDLGGNVTPPALESKSLPPPPAPPAP